MLNALRAKIATGAITAAKFAAGAIDAAAIANGAIDAATFAADVDAEFLGYLVDDATKIDASALNTASGAIGSNGAGLTEAGGDGDHLTAINLPNQTMDITGNITGNLSGSVGSVTGAVGSVTGAVGSVTGTIGGLTAAALKDFFDTDSATDYASAVAGSVVKEIADNAGGGTPPTAEEIADEVETRTIAGVTLVATTTNLTNLPTIPANWLTAAGTHADFTTEIQSGLATAAELAKVPKSDSHVTWNANGAWKHPRARPPKPSMPMTRRTTGNLKPARLPPRVTPRAGTSKPSPLLGPGMAASWRTKELQPMGEGDAG